MSKIVFIDAGHGGSDPGAVGNGLREKDLTLDIAKRTRAKLNKYNVKVVMSRTTDKFLSLSQRANLANNAKADLFVSIHINAGGGTGYEDFIYNGQTSSATKSFQNHIHNEIMKKINVRDRGKKKANFAVIRQTRMPAVLTENLFIDTKADANKLKDSKFLDALAQGHADGIAKQLGLKVSNSSTKTNTSTSKPKTNTSVSASKSISQMASEVIAGKHGSGHSNRRKSLGISQAQYEKVRAEVNKRSGASTPTTSKPKGKTIGQMATEVLAGKHGSGHTNRRKSLGISQAQYNKVRAEVNRRSGVKSKPKGKTVSQMATEVIQGKHGTGHANRRKSLGITQAQYEKVRAEVNKRS